MQKRINKSKLFLKRKVSAGLLFILAFTLLFVSCPVKKLLLRNFTSHTSPIAGNHDTNVHSGTHANYIAENEHCSFAKNAVVTTDLVRHIDIKPRVYSLNNANATGFKVNYFLSGLNENSHSLTVTKNLSVPLFLQHLRLLI